MRRHQTIIKFALSEKEQTSQNHKKRSLSVRVGIGIEKDFKWALTWFSSLMVTKLFLFRLAKLECVRFTDAASVQWSYNM